MKLLASSPTIDGIAKIINSYLYSTQYTVSKDLEILHPSKDLKGYRVVLKKGRYRFEIL